MSLKQAASVPGAHDEGVEPRDSMVVPKLPNEPQASDASYRHSIDLSGFSAVLLKSGHRSARDKVLLQEVYRCWKAVWTKTFAELNGAERVFSDDFTRQHEYVAMFHRDRCVGLSTFRYFDLDSEIARDDSYFKIWPRHALDAARTWGRSACIVSNLTVAEEYRGDALGVSVKELVTILSMRRLSMSPANAALVTTRNDRGMNEVMYRFGAHRLVHDVVLHGVKVDLVAFSRWGVKVALLHPKLSEIVRQLESETPHRRSA